jgi:hypothetical protein
MHVVWQPDIDCVDLAALQAFGILFVGIGVPNFIFSGKRFEFLRIAGDQGCDFGILLRMGKCRKNRNLRYITEPDDSIANCLF